MVLPVLDMEMIRLCRELKGVSHGFFHELCEPLTIRFNLPILIFIDFAEGRPLGEVFEVEPNVVGFGQMIEVAWVEVKEIHGCHGAYARHLV